MNYTRPTPDAVRALVAPIPISLENPNGADYLPLFKTHSKVIVERITAVVQGSSPSVTWTIKFGSSLGTGGTELVTGGTVTTNTTTGAEIVSFNVDTIPADSYVWLETSAIGGTPTWINLTLYF